MNLNDEQRAASEINSQNTLILAGPGTGKTTALVGRYQYLLRSGVDPKAILCCTFARKASDELKSRIEKETVFKPGTSDWDVSCACKPCCKATRVFNKC